MEGAGAKASRLFLQRFSTFFESRPIPADASGAYRPNPQATTKLAPRPSTLKGYIQGHFFLDKGEPFQVYLTYIVILSRVAEGLARRSHSNRSREGGMQVLTPAR